MYKIQYMKNLFLLIFLSITTISFAQQTRKLKILNADLTYTDKDIPDATISIGNVIAEINGATISCKKVIMYSKDNYLKAMGDVLLNQGDTIIQTSDFSDYDGNIKLVTSWGNVKLKDPTMSLTTEKLNFDREKQYLYYNIGGTIKDTLNVLTSKKGNYYLDSNKFQAFNKVKVVNPDQVLETNHLEYFTNTGKAYLFQPSTITGKESIVYTEKGFHDTKRSVSHLTKNSWIKYNDRLIEGDSLYYDNTREFSSATGNIKVTDTINNSILKGGYAEFYKLKDSAYVVNRPLIISLVEQDSLYIHGDTLLVTGKPDNRIIRAYHNVKFFKENLRGKCDSLISIQENGLTKMFRRPVLWSQESQITGDEIHFLIDKETEEMDSLKVLRNSFMIQKDSTGYNQTKGRVILAHFDENEIDEIDVKGNGEVIQFVRNEDDELIGITKMHCSTIHLSMKNKKINTVEFNGNPEGKTYPEEKIHQNDRKLKGFIWRLKEKPMTPEDIFIHHPEDEALMRKERIKEREQKIQAKIDEEKRKLQELKSQEIRRKQDSLAAETKELPLQKPQ